MEKNKLLSLIGYKTVYGGIDWGRLSVIGGGIKYGHRKWYNPMRYIKGILYAKYISPEKMYIS